MFNLFKRKAKTNMASKPEKETQTLLSKAIRLGLIKRICDEFIITEYGYANGCYRTRTGGIGFAGQSILLLANS